MEGRRAATDRAPPDLPRMLLEHAVASDINVHFLLRVGSSPRNPWNSAQSPSQHDRSRLVSWKVGCERHSERGFKARRGSLAKRPML